MLNMLQDYTCSPLRASATRSPLSLSADGIHRLGPAAHQPGAKAAAAARQVDLNRYFAHSRNLFAVLKPEPFGLRQALVHRAVGEKALMACNDLVGYKSLPAGPMRAEGKAVYRQCLALGEEYLDMLHAKSAGAASGKTDRAVAMEVEEAIVRPIGVLSQMGDVRFDLVHRELTGTGLRR